MPSLHENQMPESKTSFGDDLAPKQRRQMLIALTLLLAALIMVLIKDHEFWFPSAPALQSESEPVEETFPEPKAAAAPSPTQAAVRARSKSKLHAPKAAAAEAPNPASASAPVVTSRAVLPPLAVEVVTGDQHATVQAGNNAVKVDLGPKTPSAPTQAASAQPPSNPVGRAKAATRVHISPGAAELLARPVEPEYPVLAKQMKIQGAVVLQALIGRDGIIQNLHLLSGPAILSAAAREAVRQWRFRPYLQSGQAVETEARITVNFSIWTQ
jgi:TonB family protein